MSGGFGTGAARRIARCSCPRVTIDGEQWIEWPDPECREHGRPDDGRWRAHDALSCYRLVVDRKTGETMTSQEARRRLREESPESFSDWALNHVWWAQRFREETPRETEERLFSEMAT